MADPPAIVSWESMSEDHESVVQDNVDRLPVVCGEHSRPLWLRFPAAHWIVSTTTRDAFDDEYCRAQWPSMTGAPTPPGWSV